MEKIPIEFEHSGRKYKCYFTKVAGAGGTSVWHLYDHKNFYKGRLRKVLNKWVFDNNPTSLGFESLAEHFGDVITAWYQ